MTREFGMIEVQLQVSKRRNAIPEGGPNLRSCGLLDVMDCVPDAERAKTFATDRIGASVPEGPSSDAARQHLLNVQRRYQLDLDQVPSAPKA